MIKEVFLIFKTHLDIGFTDYAENVVNKYIEQYILDAIKVGYELKDTDTPFIWTVGSWLVWEALKKDKDKVVEQAIKDNIITWHALPFTTHTELMNEPLFKYGLSLSERLDKRFGRKTIASKMTDVPGHTIGMVPMMKKAGIEFLHIGVNPATPLPEVPPLFKWRSNEDEITVMYQEDYGVNAEFDDFAICFGHTLDNCGPQSTEEIIQQYDELKKIYPQAEIKAATLDDIAKKINSLSNIPIIDKEIGDTWIHGAGTDPEKVSRYRKLLRHIKNNKVNVDLSENLLLIPEHTWGMDVKTFFHNETDYTHIELESLVEQRKEIENSWQEQRRYVSEAERCLHIVSDYPVSKPDFSQYKKVVCDNFPNIELSWQLFDNKDYERYKKDYMRLTADNCGWALWDFTKIGLPDYNGGIFVAKPDSAYESGNDKIYLYKFHNTLVSEYGLPYFIVKYDKNILEIKWFDKKNSRLPQAFWLKIKGFNEKWEVHKLGAWIKPESIIGSSLITGVDLGVRNDTVIIEPFDSPLVAPYGRRLLQYNCENIKQDLYFNLYNNIWNTNFPMWYSGDAIFRFKIYEDC